MAVIIGVGPGIGAALARRFAAAGFDIALAARSPGHLEPLAAELRAEGATARWTAVDIADSAALRAAVEGFGVALGRIDVLHYNPSIYRPKDPLQLSVEELLDDVRIGVGGLLTAVQAARPFLSAGARVTATGSMAADRPSASACSLGVQKAALRNLITSLDTTLKPDGIRAMSLTVRGVLKPDTPFAADRVAEALFEAAHTDGENWRTEISYTG